LLLVFGGLLLPGVYNWLVERISRPLRSVEAGTLPRVRLPTLLAGLGIGASGWLVQGGAVWAAVQAVAPGAWPAEAWLRGSAYAALAYAAGFLILTAPGGLGVRDFLLQRFLAEDLEHIMGAERAEGVAVLATLLLRLIWTGADVAAAALAYWLPAGGGGASQEVRRRQPGADSGRTRTS
jgi:hypothetical protein